MICSSGGYGCSRVLFGTLAQLGSGSLGLCCCCWW